MFKGVCVFFVVCFLFVFCFGMTVSKVHSSLSCLDTLDFLG